MAVIFPSVYTLQIHIRSQPNHHLHVPLPSPSFGPPLQQIPPPNSGVIYSSFSARRIWPVW